MSPCEGCAMARHRIESDPKVAFCGGRAGLVPERDSWTRILANVGIAPMEAGNWVGGALWGRRYWVRLVSRSRVVGGAARASFRVCGWMRRGWVPWQGYVAAAYACAGSGGRVCRCFCRAWVGQQGCLVPSVLEGSSGHGNEYRSSGRCRDAWTGRVVLVRAGVWIGCIQVVWFWGEDCSWQGVIFSWRRHGLGVVEKGSSACQGRALQLRMPVQGCSSMGSGPKHESPTRPSKTTR